MLDNMAFDDNFLQKISENVRLNNNDLLEKLSFYDIQEMTDYYNIFDESFAGKKTTNKNSEKELDIKLYGKKPLLPLGVKIAIAGVFGAIIGFVAPPISVPFPTSRKRAIDQSPLLLIEPNVLPATPPL